MGPVYNPERAVSYLLSNASGGLSANISFNY
jgi:hypothetical protein